MASEFEDSTYSSTSEAEPDSDHEDIENDAQKLLGTWLGELENLKMGLDDSTTTARPLSTPDRLCFSSPRIDSYRFSMANLEDSHEIELDAILGELCALESQFDHELLGKKGHQRSASSVSQNSSGGTLSQYPIQNRSSTGGSGIRTDSPDNDSAFSDNISMLSSESSASSGTGVTRTDISTHSISSKSSGISMASSPTQLPVTVNHRLQSVQSELDKENLPPAEQAARMKAEKIKIALEKIREASVKKLFIKAFTADGSAKSLLVDEKMTCGYVAKLLADKNHTKMDSKWAIVEHIPDLYLERFYEDHEYLVENLLLWTRESKNKLLFLERPEKYRLFEYPENYLLIGSSSEKGIDLDDEARITLLDEFFSGNGVMVPELEGMLYLKSEGKKAWKKHLFVLRASGLYYCPKGKSKCSRDLMCLTTFDANQIYWGIGWKKKYKAPTDYCFAVKHPQIQAKSSKYMKYLCAEDEETLKRWVTGIRIAKHGRQLQDNYKSLLQDLAEDDLEVLAHARSCSIASMPQYNHCTSPVTPNPYIFSEASGIDLPSEPSTPLATLEKSWGRRTISRQNSVRSSSSSSGCLSERSSNGTATPTNEQTGFESDFPTGTIKRKPSMTPKIPLTNTTRSLAKQSMTEDSITSALNYELTTKLISGRNNLRRSLTDDRINLGSMTFPSRKLSLIEKSRSVSSEKKENDIDNLPLPPPPIELGLSMESLLNADAFPPPPPEAFRNNLSLESVATPPSERKSNSSLNSLPPPPSPLVDRSVKRNPTLPLVLPSPGKRRDDGTGMELKSPVAPVVPPKPHAKNQLRRSSEADTSYNMPPPFLAELKAQTLSPGVLRKPSQHHKNTADDNNPVPILSTPVYNYHAEGHYDTVTKPVKRLMFDENCMVYPDPPPPPPLPSPPPVFSKPPLRMKPPPPKRSNSTKLSGGATLPNPAHLTPPKAFLADLQRVMEKKWKIAQQLSMDLNSSQPVMGFRDPPYYSELLNMEYDVKNCHSLPPTPPPLPPPIFPSNVKFATICSGDNKYGLTPKRKPPPPPPKRSDSTQLTTKATL